MRTADLAAVLELLRRCDEFDDLGAFRAALATEVVALIPADTVAFEDRNDPEGLALTLAGEPAEPLHLVLRRGGHRFSAREHRLAHLLSPQLAAIHRRLCGDARRKDLLGALERAAGARAGADLRALGLSRRQTEVLAMVGRGFTNEQVARELGLAAPTVKKHLQHIYAKLGVSSRTAALARAREVPAEGAP